MADGQDHLPHRGSKNVATKRGYTLKATEMDEELRLRELRRYGILFSEPEVAFDRIAGMAKRLFQVPIALVSFVDRDIQWFKSCIGLNASETSREVSFCAHAIASDAVLVIPDAAVDSRFADNPLVADPGIRFYAGAPLVNAAGFRLGTVCVIDLTPRAKGLTEEEKQTLADLAAMAVSELELRLALKLKDEALRELETAENEIRVANERLTKSALELTRSNDDLEKFAQVCSHDLQTPARTANQFLQLLVRQAGERFDSEASEYAQIALANTKRMVQMVGDILRYSKAAVAHDPVKAEAVDTMPVFQSAVGSLAGIIQETGAVVTCDDLPRVDVDAQRLFQLFQNLIGNAIHYRSAATPRVHVSHRAEGNEEIFCVQDNGIGIDLAYGEVIFEPFKRLHGLEKSGSGVGLSICKTVVERAGGRIWVESIPGEGASFFFSLPRSRAMDRG